LPKFSKSYKLRQTQSLQATRNLKNGDAYGSGHPRRRRRFVRHALSSRPREGGRQGRCRRGRQVRWTWIKGKLVSPAGAEAVGDVESDPKDPTNAQSLQLALTKALKADPDAAKALADLLKVSGVSLSLQTATQVGDNNAVGQASGGSSVNITR
jgi:hypothetical protein